MKCSHLDSGSQGLLCEGPVKRLKRFWLTHRRLVVILNVSAHGSKKYALSHWLLVAHRSGPSAIRCCVLTASWLPLFFWSAGDPFPANSQSCSHVHSLTPSSSCYDTWTCGSNISQSIKMGEIFFMEMLPWKGLFISPVTQKPCNSSDVLVFGDWTSSRCCGQGECFPLWASSLRAWLDPH